MEKGSLLASITKQNVVANNLMNVPVLYNIRTASKKTSQFFHVPYLTPPQKKKNTNTRLDPDLKVP